MFDKDITIINKFLNKETKKIEYKVKHIKGFWSSHESIRISNTELVKNDGVTVRILRSEAGYIEPREYLGANGTWTLQNDDYLVKGIVSEVTTIADLKTNYECMKITDIAKKDYGSFDMHHFEISGK